MPEYFSFKVKNARNESLEGHRINKRLCTFISYLAL